jgi:hypothetical protein
MPLTPEEVAAAALAEANRIAVGEADIDRAIKKALRKMGVFEDLNLIKTSIAQLAKTSETPAVKPTEPTPTTGNSAEGEQRTTLKSLQEQIVDLTRGIEAQKQATAAAEANARNVRIQSDVRAAFAKHLGADSLHIDPYVHSYLGQFVDKEGKTMRKAIGEYNEERLLSVADGVEDLFKTDLKHLVTPQSKAGVLPPTGVVRAMPGPGQQQNVPRSNAITNVLAAHYEAQGEGHMAQQVRIAAATAQDNNGSK